MPSLAELTDSYQPQDNSFPVEQPYGPRIDVYKGEAPKEDFQPVINSITDQYPGLAPYTNNLAIQRGVTTNPNDDRQLEFYQPWEKENPNKGKLTTELFNKNLKGQDLTETIAGDMLHHLGTVDPNTGLPIDPEWMAMKQQMIAGMGPDQNKMNKEAYQLEKSNPAYETGSYDDWMKNNRADAYIRGALFPNQNPEWQQEGMFTPEMQQVAASMHNHLKGTKEDSVLSRILAQLGSAGVPEGKEKEALNTGRNAMLGIGNNADLPSGTPAEPN